MKIALCTTTIHVPHALKLLRKCSPDMFQGVKFFITGDVKSPHDEITKLCEDVDCGRTWNVAEQKLQHDDVYMREHFGLAEYYSVTRQDDLQYKCSELIGWNTLARRNIAFLEALKWGAEVIVSWDDDNLPVDLDYFTHFEKLTWTGFKVFGLGNWFDPGRFLVPNAKHRGYPYSMPRGMLVDIVVDAKVGVIAGLVLGDPDIDAVTRIATSPDIQQVTEIGRAGAVVDLHNWTVFNSQNTAVIRELVPAWFMMPNVGRHDDIYASLIVQRVARERNLHVHFGQPFTYQQRNAHDLIADLRAEISGMENVVKLADLLDSIFLKGRSVIEDTRIIYETLLHCAFLPEASVRAGLAWLEDVETVL